MFRSNLPAFLARLDLTAALQAMGTAAVNAVREQMASGYDQPILRTGALQQDVTCAVRGNTVTIGNTLPYAVPVHDGTSCRAGRPYLADGILAGAGAIQQAAADALRSQEG